MCANFRNPLFIFFLLVMIRSDVLAGGTVPEEQFTQTVSNLQSLARVSSGASLEIGLISGSISSDTAISELLRMGSLQPQDIIDLDGKLISDALDLLPNSASDQNTKKMEDWVVAVDEIRLASGFMSNFTEPTGMSSYEIKLGNVKTFGNILFAKLTDWRDAVNSITSMLLKMSRDFTEDKTKIILSESQSFQSYLEYIKKNTDGALKILNPLENVKQIEEFAHFYEFLQKELRLREKFVALPSAGSVSDLKITFGNMYSARENMKKAEFSIETLQKLIQTRHPSFRQSFRYSSGLSFGYFDLQKLYQDSGNRWVVNDSVVSDNLRKAFYSFKDLKTDLENIETTSWKALNDISVSNIIKASLSITQLPNDVESVSDALDNIYSCEKSRKIPTETLRNDIFKNVIQLNKVIAGLSDLAYINKGFLEKLTVLKDIVPDANEPDETKAARDYVQRMQNAEQFGPIKQTFEQLQTDLNNIFAAKSVSDLIGPIKADIKEIRDYYNKMLENTEYLEYFNCLQNNVRDNTTIVKGMIEAVQKSRISAQKLTTVKKLISDIVSSKEMVTAAKSKANDFKQLQNNETSLLKEAFGDNHVEVTNKLGMGVQGMSAIIKVYKAKPSLKPLLEKINDILKDSKDKGLAQDKQDSLQQLNLLTDVFKEVETFFMASRRRKRGFTDTRNLFDYAGNLKGVVIDMRTLREAMESLQKLNPKGFDEMIRRMDILETLDLDFSRFKIKDAIPSLATINEYFEKYGILLKKRAPLPPRATSKQPRINDGKTQVPSVKSLDSEEPSTWEKIPEWIKLPLAFIIGAVLSFIFLFLWFKRKSQYQPVPTKPQETTSATPENVKPPSAWYRGPYLQRQPVISYREDDEKPRVSNEDALAMGRNFVAFIQSPCPDKKFQTPLTRADMILQQTGPAFVDDGHANERRSSQLCCIKDTMSKITGFEKTGNFINSNVIKIDSRNWHIAQAPMDGTEEENGGKKLDIREMHWALIDQNNIKICVQLCDFKPGKCAAYYSKDRDGEITIGKYKIKTVNSNSDLPFSTVDITSQITYTGFCVYTLEYFDTTLANPKTKKVDVLTYSIWSEADLRAECDDHIFEIFDYCDRYKGDVLVQSSKGVGRVRN